jgi:hypothetical protein
MVTDEELEKMRKRIRKIYYERPPLKSYAAILILALLVVGLVYFAHYPEKINEVGEKIKEVFAPKETKPSNITNITTQAALTVCGNNKKESNEQCDGSDLGGQTCITKGFAGGTLRCKSDCTFDTSGCFLTGGIKQPTAPKEISRSLSSAQNDLQDASNILDDIDTMLKS